MTSSRQKVRVVRDYIAAINARDIAAVERIFGAECRLIDSRGGWISGYGECVEATRRMLALPIEFRLEADDIVSRPPDVLVRGRMHSSDPRLALDCLWRARTDGRHLLEWQSFATGDSLPLARMLMPEVARSGGLGSDQQQRDGA
jgi:hypothetical protein